MATLSDCYLAVAYSVRDRLMTPWLRSVEEFFSRKKKAVCYFSAEFLIGPQLARNLFNLGIYDTMKQAVSAFGLNLDGIIETEQEPGLGNGGWAAWRPVSSNPWRPLGFRPSDSASGMNTAFSIRNSMTDGRLN